MLETQQYPTDWAQLLEQQACLKPGDTRATVQLFADRPADRASDTRKRALAKVMHGDLVNPAFQAEIQRRQDEGAAIFLSVNPTDLRGRREENIVEARFAFLDADVSKGQGPAYRRFMETTKLVPTMLVESSPGNYHTYFRLKNCTRDEYPCLQRMLYSRAGTDPIHDLPRVARAAGCWHRKHSPEVPPFMSRIVETADTVYSVEELRRIVEPIPQVIAAAHAQPARVGARLARTSAYEATRRLYILFEKYDDLVKPAIRELVQQIGAEGCRRHDAVVAICGRLVHQHWTDEQARGFLVPLVNQHFSEGDWSKEIDDALAHARKRTIERAQRERGVPCR